MVGRWVLYLDFSELEGFGSIRALLARFGINHQPSLVDN